MNDFKRLKIWEKAHSLTLEVYKATKSFPKDETYGLVSQLRRASASVPANIAEGYGRKGDAELGRFLSIAAGSACEVEYHLLLAKDLGYLSASEHSKLNDQVCEIKRMLGSFISKLIADS
jgi:four helix bundle protein